jgi:DNA-binding SARP family transcriptional activator
LTRLVVTLFGTPTLSADGVPWPEALPTRCLSLLAFLALRRESMPRAAVAAALWPDEPDVEARANLRRHLHRLKQALPDFGLDWILDDGGRLGWNHAAAPVDVATFLDGIGDPERAAAAVELYRGDLLYGEEHEWIVVERERIRMLYLDALREVCVAARRRRDFAAAIRNAERLLSYDDLREDALRELIGARYEEGDRSGALATYERFALRLREALDVEPMPETVALRDAIFAGLPLRDPESSSPFVADDVVRDARDTPFVGRRSELETLHRSWMRAARGFGGTVMLAADAGVGKSRLAAELAELAEREGGRVLVGVTAQPESAPYQALVVAAQRGLPALGRDALDDVWASALAGVLPEIRAMRSDLGAAEALDQDRARLRLHEALARFFEAIARARPLVLILEDLHWAGRDTVDAIEAIARRGSGAPLLLLVTYRPEESDTAGSVPALARRLQSEQRATRLTLAALREDEIGDLIARTPAFERAPPELAPAVARLSEGNPLFAWQLLRSYEETGSIPDADGAVRTVGDAILARVDRLPSDVRAMADVAATVGRSFTVDAVAAAGGWSETLVEDGLDELLLRRLVYASAADPGTYTFAHALIASAIYAATEPAQRRPRHRRIARLLERSAHADRAALAVVARHWDLAGDAERARAAYLSAAEAAFTVFAHDEAAAYARRSADLAAGDAERFAALAIALRASQRGADVAGRERDLERIDEIAERLGDAERFAVLEAWASHFAQGGDDPRHAATIDAMFASAESSGEVNRGIAALDARAWMLVAQGRVAEAERSLAEATALARNGVDPAVQARLSIRLAYVQVRLGDGARALETLRQRRAVLNESSAPAEWFDLLNAEVNCAFTLEEMEIGARAGAEQLALARRVGDVESEGKAHGALSYVAHSKGDALRMREHSDLALATFERIGGLRALGVTLNNRGTLEFELGRIEHALHFWERAERICEGIGARDGVVTAAINRAEAELVRERFEVAAGLGRRAVQLTRDTGEKRHLAEALVLLGTANVALGKCSDGLRDLRAGIATRRSAGGVRSLPNELCYLVEASLRAGELPAAREAAEELAQLDVASAKYPARVHLVLSLFHHAAGDRAAAKRSADEGRRLLRRRLAELAPADAKAYRALPFSRALSRAAGAP